jgi:hypothetical protein
VHQAVPVADSETRLQRRKTVLPSRENVPRVRVPAQLPAAIEEAGAAARADQDFRFETATAEVASVTPAAEANSNDDEFVFFRGTE